MRREVVRTRSEASPSPPAVSTKKYSTAVVLSAVFGVIGVQHIYLRRWGEAALDIGLTLTALFFLTIGNEPLIGAAVLGLDMLHTIVVTTLLLIGKFRDGSGKIVAYPGQFERNDSSAGEALAALPNTSESENQR